MSGALALIAGLFVTSCTNDEDVYGNVDVIEQKTQGFQEAFKKAFGTINPNQTWGFKQTDAEITVATSYQSQTRGADMNANMYNQNWDCIDNVSLTSEDLEAIKRLLSPGVPTYNTLICPYENYWVQQVYKGEDVYTAVDKNGNATSTTVTGSDKMEKLVAWNGYGYEHINNFNNGNNTNTPGQCGCGIVHVGTTVMTGMPTSGIDPEGQFGFFETWGTLDKDKNNYLIVYYEGYWYVGFDYQADTDRQNPGEASKVERDWCFTDWIVRITPAYAKGKTPATPATPEDTKKEPVITTETTYVCTIEKEIMEAGKVFCEDLSNYRSTKDLDYNDAVFDATITKRTYTIETWEETFADGVSRNDKHIKNTVSGDILLTNIELYAAGGTLPLTIVGQEVHDLFKVGGTTMVNTRDKNTETVNGANTVVRESVRLINPNASTEDFVKEAFDNNEEILEKWNDPRGTGEQSEDKYYFTEFKSKKIKKILDIPVIVQYEDGNILELKSEPGKAPHKILVDKTYPGTDIAVRWASERCSIKDAYSSFTNYVNGDEYVEEKVPEFWLNGGNDDYLYEATNAISTEAAGTHSVIAKGEDNVTLYVLWQSTDPEGDDISRGLYFTDRSLLINEGIKVGDKIRFEGKKTDDSWALFLSDGNSSGIHSDLTSFNKQNYAEVTLTADMVDKLLNNNTNAAMVISGYGLALTRVSLIKK